MKRLAAVLAVLTVIRLVVAAWTPLAPDEAYYWIWSHALAPGYLDHPPMVALWIRAGTALAGDTALGVRLLGPLAAFAASLLLFDGSRRLFGARAGWWAPLLLNATLMLGVGTVIMTPDSPLLFFWTASLWAACRVLGGQGFWWLVAGVCGGLALDSKYTALFLWIGIGLWALWVPQARAWLRRWQPWAACAIGFLLFLPVLAWNAGHRWVGLLKQGGRVGDWQPARAAQFLGELLGSQLGLMTPLIAVLFAAGLAAAVAPAWRRRDARWSLLLLLSAPAILVFVQHALGDRVQGNWPAIIYPALAVAAAGWIVQAHRPAGTLPLPAAHGDFLLQSLSPGPDIINRSARFPLQRPSQVSATPAPGRHMNRRAARMLPEGSWLVPPHAARTRRDGFSRALRRWLEPGPATALGLLLTAVVYGQAVAGLIPVPPRLDPIALRLSNWPALARQIQAAAQAEHAGFIAADGYALGSELAWWLPAGTPLVGQADPHWAMTSLPRLDLAGQTGLLVRDARDADRTGAFPWQNPVRVGEAVRIDANGGRFVLLRVTPPTAPMVVLPLRHFPGGPNK